MVDVNQVESHDVLHELNYRQKSIAELKTKIDLTKECLGILGPDLELRIHCPQEYE